MKILKLIVLFAGFLYSSEAFSQKAGTVEVVKDPLIDSLIARRLELSRASNGGAALSGKGFRVQIYSGNDRKEAYAEQTKFKVLYPAVGAYISYEQPNYKIRVGDFRTRIEAEKFLNKLRPYYQSVFIFSERIYLK
ncbi:SPOR domain-containing protein [Daejeonella oryzae]|uniref:SPOR domain-containing protein n=1 Tax=Daejeonella oryzae TaxID=1122943 RepID=UPI0004279674|nr:SPOR domain-containing protein [Daejeonella oryzae]